MPRINLDRPLARRKMSKRQFAKRLGMRYEHVFRLFRPGVNPTFKTMTKWARILKCRVRDLIEE